MISRLTQWLGLRLLPALGSHDKAGPVKRKLSAPLLKYFPCHISCREFEDFVYDYYERQLPEERRPLFEYHMRICPMCESAFKAYVHTIELTGRIFEKQDKMAPTDEVPQKLVNAMLAARRRTGGDF